MDKRGQRQFRKQRQQAWKQFDAFAKRIAEAYAAVPEAEGIAEIDRICAEVRAEMKAKRQKKRV